MYYVNDGVYGSFNCILYDHAHCMPTLHKVSPGGGWGWTELEEERYGPQRAIII